MSPMNAIKRLWDGLRTSFWFFPMLIVTASIVLAVGLIAAHSKGSGQWLERWPRLFGAGADGARGMLATIAGSMMTVVGVTFSMTLVTLALASGQYTSRILRNFMRDRVTQIVLGSFAGIFVYCLIVLRTIRSGDEADFVPGLAVSFSLVLATAGIFILIYFIHHVASSIQASSIVASVGDETLQAVNRLYPDDFRPNTDDDDLAHPELAQLDRRWQSVPAKGDGYIEYIDGAELQRLATEHETIVRMELGIGEFTVNNGTLVSLALEEPPDEQLVAAVQATYSIGSHRTMQQDCAYGVRQIVDVAMRALSPSTNDTTTAVMCIDYLTAIVARVASRSFPSSLRDDAGELRVIGSGQAFDTFVNVAFDQIRGSAEGNVAVMLRLLDALESIANATESAKRRQTLGRQLYAIAELAQRTLQSPYDRARFDDRLAKVRESVGSRAIRRLDGADELATGRGQSAV